MTSPELKLIEQERVKLLTRLTRSIRKCKSKPGAASTNDLFIACDEYAEHYKKHGWILFAPHSEETPNFRA